MTSNDTLGINQEPYVRAAHFMHSDDSALFGALNAVDREVDLVIVEDPDNPLLRRHAEIRADEVAAATSGIHEKFPGSKFSQMVGSVLEGEGAREGLIDSELANLRAIMAAPGMGVFAIVGAKESVVAFIEAHLAQPE